MPDPAAIDRLDQAVAEYLAAVESGITPDRAALLDRYGDIADDLKQFFADHDRLAGLAQPIRSLIVQAVDTPREMTGSGVTMTFDAAVDADRKRGDSAASVAGQRIGDYEVIRELGRGGMGVVYQARHLTLNRVVALKMILGGQFACEDDLARFQAEARAAAALEHPGIVSIYEIGQCLGQPFFAMAFVEGPSLAEVLQSGPLAPQVATRLFRKIVAAVAYAHDHGVIHRDLKPANVLIEMSRVVSGDKPRSPLITDHSLLTPKITDFGLAKRLDGESQLTVSGQLLGTPLYMSPEQAAGRIRETGPAADVYSLGAIFYAMLTGRPPFMADNPVEVILQVLESDPPLPRTLHPEIPRELEWICLKCLEKKPSDRYASATALADDLDRYLRHEPVEARLPTIAQRFRRWMRREPVLAWHVLCLGIVLILIQAIFLLHPQRELGYHLRISGIVGLWLALSWACHWLLVRERDAPWSHYFWLAADAVMLTALLATLDTRVGALLGSYLALICVSGLFFRPRLVAFTTAVVAAASVVLFALRPEEVAPLHNAFLFLTLLVMTGLVVGYQVWRMGVLREYYDDRRRGT